MLKLEAQQVFACTSVRLNRHLVFILQQLDKIWNKIQVEDSEFKIFVKMYLYFVSHKSAYYNCVFYIEDFFDGMQGYVLTDDLIYSL